MSLEQPPYPLLARYLAGECSADEIAAVQRWVAADPIARQQLLDELASTWELARDTRQSWDANSALARIKRGAVVRLVRSSSAPLRSTPHGWLAAAAAIACVAVTASLVRWGGGATPRISNAHQYATVARELRTITLDDGSRIVLAPQSQLVVPANYANGDRAVLLRGEALFTVVHDARHPFAVHTADGNVSDIGTRFDVRAYDEETTRVAVAEGEVAFRGADMKAGDLATVADSTVVVQHGVSVDQYLAWSNGRLVFHATPLREVALQLSRWYDLDVRVADSTLGRRLFSGSYTTEPPRVVLSLITAATHTHAVRNGRVITLSSPSR